ncbi:MAG: glycosyltransferase [Planctomycetota bacterium]|jgi:glycosyltransferase involved in cell wall biosynthesis
MDFSIVIPAFNEGKRLPSFLYDLIGCIRKTNLNGEIIVVDDGSTDEGCQSYLGDMISSNQIPVHIIRHKENIGKGAAIRTGFNKAKGTWIGFVDADGATSPQEVLRIIQTGLSSDDLDGVFGSRIRMLGYSIDRSLIKHLRGRFFITLMNIMINIPFYDSQCGCKFFRRSKCLPTIELCREEGWLLDIELLAIGYRNKMNFLEIPIEWKDIPGSKVRFLRDSYKMLVGGWRIRNRLKKMGIM